MFISAMNRIDGTQKIGLDKATNTNESQVNIPFKNIFEDAVKNVVQTEQNVNSDTALLATGQSDDLHNLQIDITKAQLSLQMMVQLRNRAMDAYSEIMRMNL